MPNTPSLLPVTREIQALADKIRLEIENGKKNAFMAVEQEKKVTYWKIGSYIKEHMLKFEDRAVLGVVPRSGL